jgi:hypothetical protein
VAGNFAGTSAADLVLFRPSNQTWYIQEVGGGTSGITYGKATDLPL